MEYLSYENDKYAAVIQKIFFGFTTRKMFNQVKDQYNQIFEQIEGTNSELEVYWPTISTNNEDEELNDYKKFSIWKPQILRKEEVKKLKERNKLLNKERKEKVVKVEIEENTARLESPNFNRPLETKSKFGSTIKSIQNLSLFKIYHIHFFILEV